MLVKNKYSNRLIPGVIEYQLVNRVKQLRKISRYSQQELATRSGVSLGSIKRFERTGKISLSALLDIALVLGRLEDFLALFIVDNALEQVKAKFDNESTR